MVDGKYFLYFHAEDLLTIHSEVRSNLLVVSWVVSPFSNGHLVVKVLTKMVSFILEESVNNYIIFLAIVEK